MPTCQFRRDLRAASRLFFARPNPIKTNTLKLDDFGNRIWVTVTREPLFFALLPSDALEIGSFLVVRLVLPIF